MILIENNDILKNNPIEVELMFCDSLVMTMSFHILRIGASLMPIKVHNKYLLPYVVDFGKTNITNWFIGRGLLMNSHRNIFFTELPLSLENRSPVMPLILSLSTNSTSLSDKYWLNPKHTTEFIVNGAEIIFERKKWEDVDPFKNVYIPGQLEQYGLCDTFIIEKPENINPRSLIWSTSGCQNKRWMLDNNSYYLEKKLYKGPFENELTTLNFFLSNNVIVPQYDYYIEKIDWYDDKTSRLFNMTTRDEGLHVIQKRCLTNSDSYLERLVDYVNNDSEIEAPISRMFSHHHVSSNETDRFIKLIKEYQKQFDVEDALLDTRNMGLLIDNNGAQPVVWGRLKMRRNWVGQIDE